MSKGDETRYAILDEAARLASRVCLGGLTIGSLATQANLSKSGLFAHFRSKESLQIQVLEHTRATFLEHVVFPALAAPRGETRLRALFEGWLKWAYELPGGCLFVTAGAEFDDQPGPVRDELVRGQRDWMETIARIFQAAVAEGQFREDADADQFAQDMQGILLAYHHVGRLLRDSRAEERARRAFEALLDAARP